MEQFDLHFGAYAKNPYPFFARLREEAPIFWHEGLNAFLVSRYEDCKWVDEDTVTFFSSRDGHPPIPYVQQLDGPDHTRVRKFLNPAFSPRSLSQTVDPMLPGIANALIDRFASRGSVEAVAEFADPMATTVVSKLLNIAAVDEAWIVKFADDMLEAEANPSNKELQAKYPDVMKRLHDYVRSQVERERSEPSGSLISSMVAAASGEDVRLRDEEVLANTLGIVVAGIETTKRLISNAIFAMIHRPGALRLLLDDPDMLKPAVEETLRYHSPNQPIMRYVQKDVDLHGVHLTPGTRVYGLRSSANRDPRVWENPDTFDIHRYANGKKLPPHMSFGWGPHLCVGAYLARRETACALDAFVRRLGNLRFAPEHKIEFAGFRNRGPRELHVLFDPA